MRYIDIRGGHFVYLYVTHYHRVPGLKIKTYLYIILYYMLLYMSTLYRIHFDNNIVL